MLVRVRLFATLRERAGWSEREFLLAGGATAGILWEEVRAAFREPPPPGALPLCAVREEHAPLETPLGDGDTVAFFPPVSGGTAGRGREGGR